MSRLSEAQQGMVLRLGHPLPRHLRGEYYRRVGIVIAALPAPIEDGELYRTCASLQKLFFDPPTLERAAAYSKYS